MPITTAIITLSYVSRFQVAIGETTFDGLEVLAEQPGAKIDYYSLMWITLQRSKTAREAIATMDALTTQYVFSSIPVVRCLSYFIYFLVECAEEHRISDSKRASNQPNPIVPTHISRCTINNRWLDTVGATAAFGANPAHACSPLLLAACCLLQVWLRIDRRDLLHI